MKLEDWHTHNKQCKHAVGSIEDYILKAIELNLNTIGICDHFPFEYLRNIDRIPYKEYAILLEEIDDYLLTSEILREIYGNKINIRIAFEIDFFKNQVNALNFHLEKIKNQLDYILGSIHILNFRDGRGAWGFDDSRFRNDYKYYGTDKVYMFYYQNLQKMLTTNKYDFDIIGHFDLPKKFNDLPNNKEIVFNEVMKTLELVKKRGVVIEINSSGLRKDVKEQYPSEEIIKEIYNLDIPILLGSDAHHPDEIAYEFNSIIKIVKEIGYSHLAHFTKRNRLFIEI